MLLLDTVGAEIKQLWYDEVVTNISVMLTGADGIVMGTRVSFVYLKKVDYE